MPPRAGRRAGRSASPWRPGSRWRRAHPSGSWPSRTRCSRVPSRGCPVAPPPGGTGRSRTPCCPVPRPRGPRQGRRGPGHARRAPAARCHRGGLASATRPAWRRYPRSRRGRPMGSATDPGRARPAPPARRGVPRSARQRRGRDVADDVDRGQRTGRSIERLIGEPPWGPSAAARSMPVRVRRQCRQRRVSRPP